MSEHQCHDFLAIDRPLTNEQMKELRAISSRADISPGRFSNEYNWGDLAADPAKLMARYFDAYFYFANWGTRRLMLRLPKARIDAKELAPFFGAGASAKLAVVRDHLILDFTNETEEEYEEESPLTVVAPIRLELMGRDLRALYLGWLLAVQMGDVDETDREPPVPPGLGELTPAQEAMIEMLGIDPDLVAAGATASAPMPDDSDALADWVVGLSAKQKDAWLRRAVEEPELGLGAELTRAYRAAHRPRPVGRRRTVAELLAQAAALDIERQELERMEAERAAAASRAARKRKLDKLARDIDGAWATLTTLVATSRYDDALLLAVDLEELAVRDGQVRDFGLRFERLRDGHGRRKGFYDRWKRRARASR